VHNYRTNENSRRKALRGHVILNERDARRLRRLSWRRVFALFAVVALLAGSVLLYRSPLLRVHEVQVVGAYNADAQTIADLAGLKGHSMINLSLAGAKERIAGMTMVKGVQAERVFPNKVRITITEREPIGYWHSGAHSYVIDREGIVLDNVAPADGGINIAETAPREALQPGQHVDSDAVLLADMLNREVPARLGITISAFEFNPSLGLQLSTDAGYRVIFGDSQNAAYKLNLWQSLEEQIGRNYMSGRTLDLRFGDRPSLR
jgi:cell division protein FtsQ